METRYVITDPTRPERYWDNEAQSFRSESSGMFKTYLSKARAERVARSLSRQGRLVDVIEYTPRHGASNWRL